MVFFDHSIGHEIAWAEGVSHDHRRVTRLNMIIASVADVIQPSTYQLLDTRGYTVAKREYFTRYT